MVLLKGHGTDADKEFREALQARVDALQYPKYRIAMELGISQGHLVGILNNTRSASLGVMEKIAKGLGSSVAEMLLEGKNILGKKKEQPAEEFTAYQMKAISAFKEVLKAGGEGAIVLSEQAIRIAEIKKSETENINPTTEQHLSKSA